MQVVSTMKCTQILKCSCFFSCNSHVMGLFPDVLLANIITFLVTSRIIEYVCLSIYLSIYLTIYISISISIDYLFTFAWHFTPFFLSCRANTVIHIALMDTFRYTDSFTSLCSGSITCCVFSFA